MRATARVLSALLALTLVVVALVTLAEVVVAALGNRPWLIPGNRWYANLTDARWSDRSTRLTAVGLITVGVVLIGAAALRWGPPWLALRPSPVSEARLSRTGLERLGRESAKAVPGVTAATARAGSRRLKVTFQTQRASPLDVEAQVKDRLDTAIGRLALQRPPAVQLTSKGQA